MYELENLGVPAADAQLLLRAMDDRAVNLLAGAGISYGAQGGDGLELKGAVDLARELNTKFALDLAEPDASNLLTVYGDIASDNDLRPKLATFLRERFSSCRFTWQELVFQLPWKRLWTLNIDDVLQRAAGRSTDPEIQSYAWDEQLKVRSLSQNELQVVHLHGRAAQIDPKLGRIIFSLREYAARHEISPGWHAEFRSEFVKKPFVICGARLREEYDLATVLDFGNRSRERGGCPSFIILREFAQGEESRYRRQGLVPVAATAELFLRSLFADLEQLKRTSPHLSQRYRAAASAMRASFQPLVPDAPRPRRLLDFYSATEAQWHHILDNLDARFERIESATRWLAESAVDSRVLLLGGGPVCGKTASALRVAASLQESGYETWLFRNEERFDEQSVCEYLSTKRPTLLAFDDSADFSSSVAALAIEASRRKIPLRAVVTVDSWRLRGAHADLLDSGVRVVRLEPVPRTHFESILKVRRTRGRLGRCTPMRKEEAWEDFVEHFDRRCLEWLESLEGALSYRQAIAGILASAGSRSPLERRLLLTCAALHRFGFSLPYELAASVLGRPDIEEILAGTDPLAELTYFDDKGLRLRNRSFAIHVWSMSDPEERFDITLHLARQLAPQVVPLAISRRTYPYRLLRELMDCKAVAEDIGESADSWYELLLPQLSWNSRYWEQRALLAARNRQDETAYSYAKKAVTIQSNDAFPHTTLGTICMQISVRRRDDVGLERFWEGARELELSRTLAREGGNEWEHPYVTFFTYALQAFRAYPKQTSRISTAWSSWMDAAEASRLFRFDEQGQARLGEFQRQWLSLAVSPQVSKIQQATADDPLRDMLLPAIAAKLRADGWASLAAVGAEVLKRNPEFSPRDFGHDKLGALVQSLPYVVVKAVQSPANPHIQQLFVRSREA